MYMLINTFTAIQTITKNPTQKNISKEIQGLLKIKAERYIVPLGLSQELPHCRRLASVRISITRVANSLALNLANF